MLGILFGNQCLWIFVVRINLWSPHGAGCTSLLHDKSIIRCNVIEMLKIIEFWSLCSDVL